MRGTLCGLLATVLIGTGCVVDRAPTIDTTVAYRYDQALDAYTEFREDYDLEAIFTNGMICSTPATTYFFQDTTNDSHIDTFHLQHTTNAAIYRLHGTFDPLQLERGYEIALEPGVRVLTIDSMLQNLNQEQIQQAFDTARTLHRFMLRPVPRDYRIPLHIEQPVHVRPIQQRN